MAYDYEPKLHDTGSPLHLCDPVGVRTPFKDATIRVYKVQLQHSDGPCAWETVEGALGEVETILREGEPGTTVKITIEEMSKLLFEALDEFRGY